MVQSALVPLTLGAGVLAPAMLWRRLHDALRNKGRSGAAIVTYMWRIFFTGSFRNPREVNWVIGVLLLTIAIWRASPATRCPMTCSLVPACGSPRAS